MLWSMGLFCLSPPLASWTVKLLYIVLPVYTKLASLLKFSETCLRVTTLFCAHVLTRESICIWKNASDMTVPLNVNAVQLLYYILFTFAYCSGFHNAKERLDKNRLLLSLFLLQLFSDQFLPAIQHGSQDDVHVYILDLSKRGSPLGVLFSKFSNKRDSDLRLPQLCPGLCQ